MNAHWLLQGAIVTAVLLLSAFGGCALVLVVLKRIARGSGETAPPENVPAEPEVLRGGTWIGILERLATTGAVLAGQPGLVAIVVAVKGLGRFDELKGNPAASEKFMVGTLLSLVWAAAVGALGVGLLSWIG